MKLNNEDLEHVISYAKQDILLLKKSNIFISGGTGYIGKWLLENLLYFNEKFNLKLRIIILSRDPRKFAKNFPSICSNKVISIIKGDIRNFKFPNEKIDYVIHAATDVVNTVPLLKTFDVMTRGTKHLLDFCKIKKVKDVLILSSGAIYGTISKNIKSISEEYKGCPELSDPNSAYGLGKIISEWMGNFYSQNYFFRCKHARIFAQIGPYISLDKQFAVGNLISNLIKREELIIKGDGKVKRSYMYGSDLVIWLLAILLRGKNGRAYNVGSDQPISIKSLAKKIANMNNYPTKKIKILGKFYSAFENRSYIPDITRAKRELNLKLTIPLETSLKKTIEWFEKNNHLK